MFSKLMSAIVGSPEEGQRKLALCAYTISISAIVLFGCVLSIVFVPDATAAKSGLLESIAQGALLVIKVNFALMVVGNVTGDHLSKAIAAKPQQ